MLAVGAGNFAARGVGTYPKEKLLNSALDWALTAPPVLDIEEFPLKSNDFFTTLEGSGNILYCFAAGLDSLTCFFFGVSVTVVSISLSLDSNTSNRFLTD